MSLDVYLHGPEVEEDCFCPKCGHEHQHRYKPTLFEGNVTHNLTGMAQAAAFYREIWRPEEAGITRANQLIVPLERCLEKLEAAPDVYRRYNPLNGWGNYDGFVRFVRDYLEACREFPDAEVYASR